MKRKLEFTTSAEVKVVNSDILSNEDELEFLEMRTAVLKFDFSKVSKLARVTDDSLINEFRRFLVLKAIKTDYTRLCGQILPARSDGRIIGRISEEETVSESDLDSRYERLLEEYRFYFKEDPLAGDRGVHWSPRAAHWFARPMLPKDAVTNAKERTDGANAADDITLRVRCPGYNDLMYKIKRSTPLSKIFRNYSEIKGLNVRYLHFFHQGEMLSEIDTPERCGIEDGDVLDVILSQIGDIGYFDVKMNSAGSQYLMSKTAYNTTAISHERTIDESSFFSQVITTLGGSSLATFIVQTLPCIGPADLASLRCYMDNLYNDVLSMTNGNAVNSNSIEDLKIYLKMNELLDFLSAEIVQALTALFADSFDEIILRRCCAYGKFIAFHTDCSLKTMQVALNDADEYGGGRLTYLTSARGLEAPHRAAGTITIHANDIVHGVSELTRGVRYGLFFIKKA